MECSSWNLKIVVSDEMGFFAERTAFVQARGWRNVGRGSLDVVSIWGSESLSLEDSSRVPMWYFGIMLFAVSESVKRISGLYGCNMLLDLWLTYSHEFITAVQPGCTNNALRTSRMRVHEARALVNFAVDHKPWIMLIVMLS